jgi:dTMP kinase
MKGIFITFEGSEGSGKSTQSRLLCRYLKTRGLRVVFLREPGGTAISEKIRAILLDCKNKSMSSRCETLLYMAARSQVVAQLIKPAMAAGAVVVSDRFLDSTLAYQGYGLGIDLEAIRRIGLFATEGVKPDLTFFMDLPLRDGLRHRMHTKDRIEKRPYSYHARVRNGYLAMAQREPRRIKIVTVRDERFDTQAHIRRLVDAFLARHGANP